MKTSFLPNLQRDVFSTSAGGSLADMRTWVGAGASTTGAASSSSSGGGSFWDSLGSTLVGASSVIAAIKGNPATVNNIIPQQQFTPLGNGMGRSLLPILLILGVVVVLFMMLKPKA